MDLETILNPKNPTLSYLNVCRYNYWLKDLVELVFRADREGKLLRNIYYGIVFTPRGLAAQLCKGKFVWGVANWELVDPPVRPDQIDYPDPKE